MEMQTWLVGALCMGSIVVLFFGMARALSSRNTISNRFEHYVWRRAAPGDEAAVTAGPGALTRGVDSVLARRGNKADLTRELARADLRLTPAEFVIINFTCVFVALGLGLIIFKVWYVALPFSWLGYYVPRVYVRFRQSRRQAMFSAQMPTALNLLASSLRSGYSLQQSMELLAKEIAPPIGEEFGRVVREMGLGVGLEGGLNNLMRRMENPDLELLVNAILIQHQVGGNLSEILEIISHTIRERVRIKAEIRVLTSQQQLSGYVVGALPFGITVVLFIVNPSYMGQLFNGLCGILVFFTAFLLVGLAFLLIRKIVAIEV
jgi:tight adherence protein B